MVVLLTQLKVFQSIGHFLPLSQIPATALSYVAKRLSLAVPTDVSIDPRTTYRQYSAIRAYLGISRWGASARAIVSKAVAMAAETRLDPADVVNAAIDQLDSQRRPIVPRIGKSEVPASVAEAVRLVMDEMPERSVLEALANTARWVDWTRHCGLPSRMNSGIANLRERYLITTFAYGCGLGATQAARHFGGAVLPEELSFVVDFSIWREWNVSGGGGINQGGLDRRICHEMDDSNRTDPGRQCADHPRNRYHHSANGRSLP